MKTWRQARAVQRIGLDFRKTAKEPDGYFVKMGREVTRNLGLFAVIVVLGLMLLPPADGSHASDVDGGMPKAISIKVAPLDFASAN